MKHADELLAERIGLWRQYHAGFAGLEAAGLARRPVVPDDGEHNAHLYYLLLPDAGRRDALIAGLKGRGIQAPFHYVPLHASPGGRRYGREAAPLPITEDLAARLVRMPLWYGMDDEPARVIAAVHSLLLPAQATKTA